jgi:hypothetical protein
MELGFNRSLQGWIKGAAERRPRRHLNPERNGPSLKLADEVRNAIARRGVLARVIEGCNTRETLPRQKTHPSMLAHLEEHLNFESGPEKVDRHRTRDCDGGS